jgi:hypothetical protein
MEKDHAAITADTLELLFTSTLMTTHRNEYNYL